MKKRDVIFSILGWGILAIGMGVFLFVKDTTPAVRIFAVACCVVSFVLFGVRKKKR